MPIDTGASLDRFRQGNISRPRPGMGMSPNPNPNMMGQPNPMGGRFGKPALPMDGALPTFPTGGTMGHPGNPMGGPVGATLGAMNGMVRGPSMMPSIGQLTSGTNTGFMNPMSPNITHPSLSMSPSMGQPMGQPNPNPTMGPSNPMMGGHGLWQMYNQLAQEQGMPNRARQF